LVLSLAQISSDPRAALRIAAPPVLRARCVLYWMRRAQRAFDNPALETAIAAANELKIPVVVFFCLRRSLPHFSLRHLTFMLAGLSDTAMRLHQRGIGFVLRIAQGRARDELGRVCDDLDPAIVVSDENPLGGLDGWKRLLPPGFSRSFVTVDADVIVPSALLGKEQYAARTIRPRLHAQLDRFLQPVVNQTVHLKWRGNAASLQASLDLRDALHLDHSVGVVPDCTGGTAAALARLNAFIKDGLPNYAAARNHPGRDGTSRLSPYLHYGQLGPHTIALSVRASGAPEADKHAFLEELIVRRELAINFVRYNQHYRSLVSSEPWALKSLRAHEDDRRDHRYSARQLEQAETHDRLWNAAQRQMARGGWMHNYMRMYWAKKILEWSPTPAQAYEIAVALNDRYELDGRDANGYAGIAWAIGGKHDRAWSERPIFGKIRYMSAAGAGRKFDSRAYIARWGG